MKKFFSTLALLLCALAWAMPQTVWAAEVYYGGQLVCQSEQIYDSVDGMCVPVRQFFEALDYEVEWLTESNTVWLRHSQHGDIRLRVGDMEAGINGYFNYRLTVAPYFHDDVLYASVNFLEYEYCDYNLNWLPATKRWQITDKQPEYVLPFADLTREQLSGVTLHFGNQNSHIPIYTAELADEDIAVLLDLLRHLACREPDFVSDDEDWGFSGAYGIVFDLHYTGKHKAEFGFTGPFYELANDNEEAKYYLPLDFDQQRELENYYRQLKDKYLTLQNN